MKKFSINFLEKGGKFYSAVLPQKDFAKRIEAFKKANARFITATALKNSGEEVFIYYHFEIDKKVYTVKTKPENLKAQSLSKFYPNISWVEREMQEFYKINFQGQAKKPLLYTN